MKTPRRRVLLVMPLLMLAACEGRAPTQPTASRQTAAQPAEPPPISPEDFEVAGVVADERGVPMPGATVTMAHWRGGTVRWPSVVTDASGSYRIRFSGTTLGNGFVARAQVIADGYEEYWRSIKRSTGATSFVESFRLDRITRIAAGESIVLSVPSDVGECRGWVAELCPPVRVTVATQGRLRIEVSSVGPSGEPPPVEVCCVGGDEQIGNPIIVPVVPGPELEVRVGLRRGFAAPASFLVKTSLESS